MLAPDAVTGVGGAVVDGAQRRGSAALRRDRPCYYRVGAGRSRVGTRFEGGVVGVLVVEAEVAERGGAVVGDRPGGAAVSGGSTGVGQGDSVGAIRVGEYLVA